MEYLLKPPANKWSNTMAAPCAACAVRERVFCSVLSDIELDKMTQYTFNVSLSAKRTILNEGDPSDHFYNITEGVVKVYKLLPDGRQQVTGFLFPGDFLGIAKSEHYAYTAECVTDTKLCRINHSDMERMFSNIPKLEGWMLNTASNELIQAQDQFLLLGRKTAIERFCSFLITLSKRAGTRSEPEQIIHLPMGRESIADYLGLTTETISRTISKLKKLNVITLPNKATININDMNKIQDMAISA